MRVLAWVCCVGIGVSGCDGDKDTDTDTDADADADADTDTNEANASGAHRVYLGTGEYSPTDTWDGILRFEGAEDANGTLAPDGTVPVKQSGEDNDADGVIDASTADVRLNFVHTIYVDETRDEMYVGALFTTADNSNCGAATGNDPTKDVCGSIAVIANASSMDGPQIVTRHIFGDATELNQPHGIWVDADRDILYAANTFGGNILAWESASSADGNVAPDRIIDMDGLGFPVHLYVDGPSDRMFVVAMDPTRVLVFESTSTLDGNATTAFTIDGNNTRLQEGNNKTTHNVWFVANAKTLIVGHHTNEVLFYDLSGMPGLTGAQNLAPRVLEVQDSPRANASSCTDSDDANDWSTYGFYYVSSSDTLYASNGYAESGTCTHSGAPPATGGLKHVVRVYDNVSDAAVNGLYPPSRKITWSNAATYYPPQALWVSVAP